MRVLHVFALALMVALGAPGAGRAREADLALVLAIDCSYSIDDSEFDQQRFGLAAAFLDPRVVAAIGTGAAGAILVTVVQWSNSASQVQVLPWTRVAGLADAAGVAERLVAMKRRTLEGGTSISAAIDFSRGLLADPALRAARRVIDVSADGRNNNGRDVRAARDAALAAGITVNGLVILNAVPTLGYYFRRSVLAGDASFVVEALSYEDYGDAMLAKLVREITGNMLSRRAPPPDAPWDVAKARGAPLPSTRIGEGEEARR
ncbi:MAG: DUF1194 domain-containing protein [Alphaproteobacteria bacterium]